MIRDIKFRAWDGKNMFPVDVLAISPCAWDCPDYGRHGVSLAYQPSIKVMQYTGLHDKNGKEIYEKDLILDDSYGPDVSPTPLIGVVVWNDEKGAWCWDNDKEALIAESVDTIKVIGNVFEDQVPRS